MPDEKDEELTEHDKFWLEQEALAKEPPHEWDDPAEEAGPAFTKLLEERMKQRKKLEGK